MTVDVTQAAQLAMTALSPYLPYLAKLGEGAFEEVGKTLAGSTWEKASELWNRLRDCFQNKEHVKSELNVLGSESAGTEEKADARASIELEIRKVLRSHPELLQELGKPEYISTANTAIATNGSIAVGGSVQNSPLTTHQVKS
jgi:hypothetical protein